MLVSFIVFSPDRGSEFLVRTTIFRSGDVQISEITWNGRSFPCVPVAQVWTVRWPLAITPSIICGPISSFVNSGCAIVPEAGPPLPTNPTPAGSGGPASRSEEHTSELQSLRHLVCRLLLEKKKQLHSKYQQ